jgi:hypothetical protein
MEALQNGLRRYQKIFSDINIQKRKLNADLEENEAGPKDEIGDIARKHILKMLEEVNCKRDDILRKIDELTKQINLNNINQYFAKLTDRQKRIVTGFIEYIRSLKVEIDTARYLQALRKSDSEVIAFIADLIRGWLNKERQEQRGPIPVLITKHLKYNILMFLGNDSTDADKRAILCSMLDYTILEDENENISQFSKIVYNLESEEELTKLLECTFTP